jgi:hypothetical protein
VDTLFTQGVIVDAAHSPYLERCTVALGALV